MVEGSHAAATLHFLFPQVHESCPNPCTKINGGVFSPGPHRKTPAGARNTTRGNDKQTNSSPSQGSARHRYHLDIRLCLQLPRCLRHTWLLQGSARLSERRRRIITRVCDSYDEKGRLFFVSSLSSTPLNCFITRYVVFHRFSTANNHSRLRITTLRREGSPFISVPLRCLLSLHSLLYLLSLCCLRRFPPFFFRSSFFFAFFSTMSP